MNAATLRRRRRIVTGLLIAALLGGTLTGALVGQATASPILRTTAIGHAPYGTLALDTQTNRAFVFNRHDGTMSVLDPRSGALARTVTLAPGDVWVAVATRAGRVFVSSYGAGTISMLDAQSGTVLRTVTDGGDTTIAVDERRNHVFVGNANATISMLDAHTGAILRRLSVCSGPFIVALSVRTDHLFAKCNDGTTDMLDAQTGHVLRTIPNNSGSYGCMLVDERTNRVFTVGNQPQLDMLDARTGAYLHALSFDASACPIADARTGDVYIALGNASAVAGPQPSRVVVLDGRSGALLRRISVATNPLALALDDQHERLFVGSVGALDSTDTPTSNGTLSVLNSASGRVLRMLRVGITPSDIAVAPSIHRVLVVNSYSDADGHGWPVMRGQPEGWQAQTLRRLKRWMAWLPITVPAHPVAPANGTVTTLDLSRL